MKKILLRIFSFLLAIVSILLILYPFISNYLLSLNQDSQIVFYDDAVAETGDTVIEEMLEESRIYNKSLFGNIVITDPFDPDFYPETDYEYEALLNLNGDGIMGYVEVPVINLNLPIYHGTSQEVLVKAVGHLQNTSLPVGGKGTHAVLTGHTAYPGARLFTDIDQLVLGDIFFVYTLNQKLAYQVDQIKVVLPSDTDDLKINPDEDYVTLVTCTPYGINTHRLLVRGIRIPYEEAEKAVAADNRKVESTWMYEYKKALVIGAVILVFIISAYIFVRKILRKHRTEKTFALSDDKLTEKSDSDISKNNTD